MEVNLSLLIEYTNRLGLKITVNISVNSPDSTLIFISGENREGSRREYVDFSDLYEILILNNIIGRSNEDESLVKKQLELARTSTGDKLNHYDQVERLIYECLAKYIIQILLAGNEKIYFPEIKHLKKHKDHFRGK